MNLNLMMKFYCKKCSTFSLDIKKFQLSCHSVYVLELLDPNNIMLVHYCYVFKLRCAKNGIFDLLKKPLHASNNNIIP